MPVLKGSSHPTTRKVDLSRSRVLDAAAKIFRERGYQGTTMRIVATAAGTEAGSIYYHYRSKDELIGAVLDFGMTALTSSVETSVSNLPRDADHRLQIETAIHAHVSAILKYGDYTLAMRRVFGQVPMKVWRRHVRLREQYGNFWHSLLASAQKSGAISARLDLAVARLFLLGGLNWIVEWYDPKGKSIEQLANTFSGLLLDGMMHSSGYLRSKRPT